MGIFFPVAGDTVSGGVGDGKGLFYSTELCLTDLEKFYSRIVVEEYLEMLDKYETTWIFTSMTIRRGAPHRLDWRLGLAGSTCLRSTHVCQSGKGFNQGSGTDSM